MKVIQRAFSRLRAQDVILFLVLAVFPSATFLGHPEITGSRVEEHEEIFPGTPDAKCEKIGEGLGPNMNILPIVVCRESSGISKELPTASATT